MVVLQINATYGIGSTGRNVFEMDRYLREQGHKSYVAWGISTIEKSDNIFQVGNWLDHKWHALMMRITGKQGFYSKHATKQLCKKIDKIQPDIVHLHNLHSNYICLPILLEHLASKDYPVVITLHDCWFFTGRCYHYYELHCEAWKSDCADCPLHNMHEVLCHETRMLQYKKEYFSKLSRLGIIGVSNWVTEEAKKSILKNSCIIQRIYNWIDCDIFKPLDSCKLKKELGIEDKKVILGVSQGWSQSKGMDEMLGIAQKFGDEAVVILIGQMEEVNKLPDNILTVGYIKDAELLAQYYSLADVFVNPSKMETFGKVSAEAMACGTPVVVYDNTGSKELVPEGCGKVAPNGNIDKLIECVEEALTKGRAFYFDKCIAYVKQEFDIDTQLHTYCDLYNKLLRGN